MPDTTTCTMDLPPPQVMSIEGQQDDAVADGRRRANTTGAVVSRLKFEEKLSFALHYANIKFNCQLCASQVNKDGQTLIVPEVGKTYDPEEAAYDMYNTYAGKVGFSIRKNQTKHRHDGSIYQKYIVCSNQGHRETA